MKQKKNSNFQLHSKVPFFYGWIIIGLGALTSFFSGPGQTFSISIFIDTFIENFGWSRTFVSSLYSIATFVSGGLIFFMGRLIDKFGQRIMILIVGLSLGLACLWSSFIFTPTMLFIGFLLLRYFGQGSMMIIPATLIPQWFIRKRGMALSIMYLGNIIAFAVFPPINTWFINTWGADATWRFWGILLIFLFTPVAFMFVRNKPESIGLLPDNGGFIKKDKETNNSNKTNESWTLKESLKVRQFWSILFCRALPPMIETGFIFHMISILGEKNVLPTTASLVMSTIAIVSFAATFLAGFVADKLRANYVFLFSFAIQIIAMFLLLYSSSVLMAFIFGAIWGISWGFEKIAGMVIWPNYFGRHHIGSIIGVERTTSIVASALGPILFGLAFDQLGGYFEMIVMVIVLSFLGIISALISTHPKRQTEIS